MAKDKLITLLIEEEKRDRLKQHCANLGLTVSQVLSKCIDDILNGSIDPSPNSSTSISPLDLHIDIEAAIDRREPRLLNILFDPANQINTSIQSHDRDIQYLKTCLQICEDKIDNLTKFIKTTELPKPTQEPNPSGLTLEDTKDFLTTTYKDNLSSKPSDRTNQQAIAELLLESNYPHPTGKKWNRDEVRDICKLWDIKTK